MQLTTSAPLASWGHSHICATQGLTGPLQTLKWKGVSPQHIPTSPQSQARGQVPGKTAHLSPEEPVTTWKHARLEPSCLWRQVGQAPGKAPPAGGCVSMDMRSSPGAHSGTPGFVVPPPTPPATRPRGQRWEGSGDNSRLSEATLHHPFPRGQDSLSQDIVGPLGRRARWVSSSFFSGGSYRLCPPGHSSNPPQTHTPQAAGGPAVTELPLLTARGGGRPRKPWVSPFLHPPVQTAVSGGSGEAHPLVSAQGSPDNTQLQQDLK